MFRDTRHKTHRHKTVLARHITLHKSQKSANQNRTKLLTHSVSSFTLSLTNLEEHRMAAEKILSPAYVSFKSFKTFFDARREDGHITTVIDRSLMQNFSGSTINELLASLKFLGLMTEKGSPTPHYEQFVVADDEKRKSLLQEILKPAYGFLYEKENFDLERGTSAQMADIFRSRGVNGSTLSKAIAFFLAAAKDAGIKVSPNIKAPPIVRNGAGKPKKEQHLQPSPATPSAANPAPTNIGTSPPPDEGYQAFEIPIPIDRKVRLIIPKTWTSADWDLFQSMLKVYIEGWKSLAATNPNIPHEQERNE
jgi:Family of unknown function (DUF5343)